MNRKIFKYFFVFLMASLTMVLSCDIGLGSAVDTESPTLLIQYPPSGAIIRDSFILSGSCKDDVGVTDITVSIRNTTSGKVYPSKKAEISEDKKSWLLELNEKNDAAYLSSNGWEYPDGTYEVSIVASDASGKTSGTSSRTLDIDNTAPVFIIQSPGVTKKNVSDGATATAYGTNFTVSGTIVDNHEIGKLSMNFFDENGIEISDAAYVESSVPTAGGTEVTIATYVNDANYSSSQYNKLYNGIADENSETKKFYCTVELEDVAEEYKERNDGRSINPPVKKGNATTDVYLYDDVFTDFLSTKTATVVQGGLSAANFMNVLNGTYSSDNAAAIKEEILKRRKDTTVTENNLAFSLNPNADPKYIVNGFELTKAGDVYGTSTEEGSSTKISQAGNNNTLNISISAGLDGTAIAPWSVHVWMYDFGNAASDFKIATVQEIVKKFRTASKAAHKDKEDGGYVTKSGSKYMIAESDNADYKKYIVEQVPGIEYIGDNIKSGASSSKQATVSTNLPRSIASGHYYVILVSGYDVERTEFAQSETFGFVGMATGERPKIAVTSPADLSYAKMSDDVVFKGTATKGDAVVKEVKATITVTDEADGTIVGDTGNNPLTCSKIWDDTVDERNWEISLNDFSEYSKIKADEASGKSYLYSVKFEAIDTAENSADITRSVHVDAVKPEVAITSITPVVAGEDYDGTSNNYVNGNITVKANISETNLAEVNLKVLVGGEDVTSTVFAGDENPGKLGKTFQVNKKINTTLVEDNKPIEIIITAKDTVGNTTEYSSKEFNGNVDYIVNQDSDKPVFKFMNFADHNVYATEDQATAGKFYNTVDKAVSASTNTDDMTVCPDGQSAVKGKAVAGKTNNGKQIYEYLMIIENSNLFSESNKNMMFTVTDDDMIKNVVVKIYREDGTTVAKSDSKDGNGTTYQGNIEVPSADGIYYFEISATDEETGKTSVTRISEKIKFAVSSHKPVINFDGSGSTYFKAAHPVNIAGTVTSWDSHVVLSRVTGSATPVSFTSGNIGGFTDSPTAVAPSDGSTINTVEYEAVNTFGQKTSATFSYNIDEVLPEISISSITPTVARKQADDTYKYFVNGKISVTGKSNDNSDIDYVEYKVFKGSAVPADASVLPVANGIFYKTTSTGKINSGFEKSSTVNSWEFIVDTTKISGADNSAKDSMCIQVTVHDLAGNKKSVTSGEFLKVQSGSAADVSYFVDQETDRPEINPSNFVYLENGSKDVTYKVNGNLFGISTNNKLIGSIGDDDGVNEAACYFRPALSYNADGSAEFGTEAANPYKGPYELVKNGSSTSVNLTQILPASEGKYEIYFYVKDVEFKDESSTPFNHVSTKSKPYYVGVSNGSPTIKISLPDNNCYTRTQDKLNVSGTVSNADGTSIDIISSVERLTGSDSRDAASVYSEKLTKTADASNNTFVLADEISPVEGKVSGDKIAVTYRVTDIFGQTADAVFNYIIDDTKPAIWSDVTNKKFNLQMANGEFIDSKWYSGSDISIEGWYVDADSGISEVKYVLNLVDHGNTGHVCYKEICPGWKEGDPVNVVPSIIATKVTEKVSGVDKEFYRFKGTISGYVAGQNSLELWTVDLVGNESVVTKKTVKMDDSAPEYSAKFISVDGGKTSASATGTVTVNGKQSVLLYGTIKDTASGVKSVDYKLGSGKDFITAETLYTTSANSLSDWNNASGTTYQKYSDIIDKSKITGFRTSISATLIDDGTLSVTTFDEAGNKGYNPSVLTFTKDDVAPAVKISSTADNVNGIKTISGTVTETYTLANLELWYSTKNDSDKATGKIYPYSGGKLVDDPKSPEEFGWKKFGETVTDISKIYSWNFESFDFNSLSEADTKTDGKADIYILPVVKDAAGNCNAYDIALTADGKTEYTWNLASAAQKFSVDMNADRPVVQVTNLAENGSSYILKYGTNAQISGTLTDDDSTCTDAVKKFFASGKEFTFNTVDGKAVLDESKIEGTTVLTGTDWTFTPADPEDGSKTVYFYIEDNEGNVFYTGNAKSGELYRPYFQFKSNAKVSNDGVLNYDSDQNSPSVEKLSVKSYASSAAVEVPAADETITTSVIVGGTKEKFVQFVIEAKDANGIAGMTLSVADKKFKIGDTSVEKDLSGYVEDGTLTPGADGKTSTWTTSRIDISGWTTGAESLVVNVYDNSGLKGNGSATFNMDNTKPTVTITSPASTDEVTGTVKLIGTTSDAGGAGVESVKYLVPPKGKDSVDDVAALSSDKWSDTLNTSSLASWVFSFDGLSGNTHCPSLTEYDDENTYASTVDGGIYTIPVYIRAEDSLGNVEIFRHSIKHNPDGDKPKTTFTYPTAENYDKDSSGTSLGYATLGGTMRISGNVEIPSLTTTVKDVYVQIASSAATFNSSDKTKCSGSYGLTVVDAAGAGIESGISDADKSTWWGIKASSTSSSWFISLNSDGKMNSTAAGTTNDIAIRACGVNKQGKVGAWSEIYYIHIDNNAPTATVTLAQYDDDVNVTNVVSKTPAATNEYKMNMWLRGQWYLVAEILDESGILDESIVIQHGNTVLAPGDYAKDAVSGAAGKTGYKLYIPISTATSSSSYTITAMDGDATGHTWTDTYKVQIDNDAPEITEIKNISSDSKIADSNYSFTVSGGSKEDKSGLYGMVFFFKRGTTVNGKAITKPVYMDPLLDNSQVELKDLDSRKITLDTEECTVYGKNYSGSQAEVDANKFKISSTKLAEFNADEHIRKNGLIYIGGMYRKITDITGDVVTFDSATAGNEGNAFFVYAQVVDNEYTETGSYGASGITVSNDDGDGMPESFKQKDAENYEWLGTVQSAKMNDGPVTLVVLAIDKAGNISFEEIDTMVSNNAPRIAKVYLGTDINGNGKFAKEEFVQYSWYDKTNSTTKAASYKEKITLNTADNGKPFVIKNKLAVVPEVIGGNGNLKLAFNKAAVSDDAFEVAESALISDSALDAGLEMETTSSGMPSFVLSNTVLNGGTEPTKQSNTDGTDKKMSFTFWDETEETTPGNNSQNAVIYVTDFTLTLVDKNRPNVVVRPFKWVDKDDNSLFENKTTNGHIELEGDIAGTNLNKAPFTVGAPKVSGKIVFRGTAYDDVCLNRIYFSYGVTQNEINAQYDKETETWSIYAGETKIPSGGSVTGDEGWNLVIHDVISPTAKEDAAKRKNFSDTDAYFGQDGHKVAWEFTVDTEKRTNNVAKIGEKLSVTAYDSSNNDSGARTTDTVSEEDGTRHNPVYTVDVVPYVVKVETGLSKQKKSNWSVYNRSALGHYPVQSVIQKASTTANGTIQRKTTSEDVTLHGFNLNGTVAVKDKDNGNLVMTPVAPTGTSMSQIKFNVAKLASGEFNPTVNGISIINNMNNNDAMGAATEAGTANVNKYNMQGNGDTNNILTDDLVFDVWEFNDRAAVPINGMATGVQMQVNQNSKMLNFAFANGGLYFSMADGTYSSQYWAADYDTMAGPSVGFHVDSLGYTYATDSGGDTNTSGSVDKYDLWSSRFGIGGRNQKGTLTDAQNALNLEEIALKLGPHDKNLNYSLMKYRYLSSEMASAVHGNNTNLYLVNYDALTDEIRFRAGTFTKTSGKETSCGFQDEYNTAESSYYSTNNCQVIANNSVSGGSFIKNDKGEKTTVKAISGRGAGQYVDVAVATNGPGNNDVACVIWYDAYENCLKYTYYENPIGNWDSLKGNRTADGWSEPKTIFAEGGEYCQIVVDKKNHLHIAAYAGNGDVKYAYLESYNSSYSEDTNSCVVDASGAVGEHLTLDVALDGNENSIPYIGYFTAAIKAPKYAYLVDTNHANKVPAGVDDDERFTGAWEVTVVPTPSRLTSNREDKVNIGVFKTAAGVLNWSTTNGKEPAANGSNIGTNEASSTSNGYSSTERSKAYGNGSKNAVFAYQISGGTGSCIEIAQMR